MTSRVKLPCPSCGDDIKLRRVSPSGDPIQKYPAVRPCPSCGVALRLDLPGWVIPSLVGLILALGVIAIAVVDSTTAPVLQPLLHSADRGLRKLGGMLLAVPILAMVFPAMVADAP